MATKDRPEANLDPYDSNTAPNDESECCPHGCMAWQHVVSALVLQRACTAQIAMGRQLLDLEL